MKMSVLPNVVYKFNVIQIKTPGGFFPPGTTQADSTVYTKNINKQEEPREPEKGEQQGVARSGSSTCCEALGIVQCPEHGPRAHRATEQKAQR